MYPKDQIYLIFFVVFLLLFPIYFYFQHREIEEIQPLQNGTVKSVHCRSYKGRSSIFIEIKNEEHSVGISKYSCAEFKPGEKVTVLYNPTWNYYFLPGRSEINISQIKLLIFILILALIPWKRIFFKNTKF